MTTTPSKLLLKIIFSLLALRLLYFSWQSSMDFAVYWNATSQWLQGNNPYLIRPEDQGFVFKYPPWTLPLLTPFAIIPWTLAKSLWALLQLGLLAYCSRVLYQYTQSPRILAFTLLGFWWIFQSHFFTGQISILLLTLCLFTFQLCNKPQVSQKVHYFFLSLTTLLLSTKIFTLISCIGFFKNPRALNARRDYLKWIFFTVLVAIVLTVLSLLPLKQFSIDALLHSWLEAAASGQTQLDPESVKLYGNVGFPAFFLRLFSLGGYSLQHTTGDLIAFIFCAIFFGWGWQLISKKLTAFERFSGWLALAPLVHPLSWNHSFVFALPLCTLALHRSYAATSFQINLPRLCSGLGFLLTAPLSLQLLGASLTRPLEWCSSRSWGVLLLALTFLFPSESEKKKSSDL